MAASPIPRPTANRTSVEVTAPANPCDGALARWCERWRFQLDGEVATVAVAFSGGADSTALLLAAHQRWPGRVVALHVHHGLQAAADEFERHVRRFCDGQHIALRVAHARVQVAPGDSTEDAARRARYAALGQMAATCAAAVVFLGQHADDQAETVVLALSRGAGLPGLAGMAERFEREGMSFARPLLEVPGDALRAWLDEAGQTCVDDPTNAELRFTRNRIRHRLMPAWAEVFPGHRQALARSARHAAQAQSLLDALADLDLDRVGCPPRIADLQLLARDRQANAVRRWLKRGWAVAPSEVQLHELLHQIEACRTRGHRIAIRVANGMLVRDGTQLAYTPPI